MNQSHKLGISDIHEMSDIQNYPEWLARFIDVYEKLSTDNLNLINNIYDKDICFQDPMHELTGIEALNDYFSGLYENLSYCHFTIQHVICEQNQAAIYWEMCYQHKKLNNGNEVSINGSSRLISNGSKVIFHRDYLDLGAMLYEQLPLLGRVIRYIKNKAAN